MKNELQPPEMFYTVDQIAEFLWVSVRSVRRWIKNNELVGHHFGRSVRVGKSSLDAFLAAGAPLPAK